MRLLLDQNLPARLLIDLARSCPDSAHVMQRGLARADDEAIWQYAARHGYTIVTKDADFHQMSFVRGAPPKVIWIRVGNASTESLNRLLQSRAADILSFGADPEAALLTVSG